MLPVPARVSASIDKTQSYLFGCNLGCTGETLDNRTSYPVATPAKNEAMLYSTNSMMLSFCLDLTPNKNRLEKR